MLSLKEKIQLSNKPLKCISKLPLAVGGSENFLILLNPRVDVNIGTAVNSCASFSHGVVFGTSDGRVGIFKNNVPNFYNLHTSNVCSIDYKDGLLVTASWDNSINILQECPKENANIILGEDSFTQRNLKLNETIWKVRVVTKNVFATAGTGQKITLYKNNKIFKEIDNHAYVIRDFFISENDIYSVDNYGKVLKTSVSGEITRSKNLDEMCFCMCFYNKYVVIGGDNGSIFILNTDLQCVHKLRLPCTSVWDVKADEEFVYCAGSDGILYKLAEGSGEDVFVESQATLDNTNVETNSKSLHDGYFVSEGVEYQSKDGQLFKRVGDKWESVGYAFQSKQPDNTFTVELSGKNYTLTFNNDENVHEVADRFLSTNKIDKSHHQEIVDFINKNFRKENLYSYYSHIELEGIAKTIGKHPIVDILKEIVAGTRYRSFEKGPKSVQEIEKHLSDNEIPNFVKLDICKYLVYKKIPIDLSFLFKIDIQNKKEAKAFVFLLTNMVEDPVFNLKMLYEKVKRLNDLGLISLDDMVKLNNNRKIKDQK